MDILTQSEPQELPSRGLARLTDEQLDRFIEILLRPDDGEGEGEIQQPIAA